MNFIIKNSLLTTLLSLLVLLSPSLPVVFGQESATACFTTDIGTPLASPVYPPGCSQGGIPDSNRTTLLARIKEAVEAGKIKFAQSNDRTGMTNGTGQVRRSDGSVITIDTQLLRFYVYMVDQGYTFEVSSMIGTHSKFSSSGNISRHWDGHAADISIINNAVVNQTSAKDPVVKFMTTLNGLVGKDIVPRQVLCSGAGRIDSSVDQLSMDKGEISPGFTAKYVGNHIDHVHVGY